MTIYSGVNEYTVLARLYGDRRRLIARGPDGRERLLVIVDHPPLAKHLMPLFLTFEKNDAFTDFIEVFPCGDGFCAVFEYYGYAQPLEKALEHAPYQMRAAALRALFAKLLSQDVPRHLLTDILRPDNLMYLPDGEVGFLYDLHFDGGGLRPDMNKVALRLSEIADKIGDGADLEPMNALCRILNENRGDSWTELYAAASEAANALETHIPEPEPVKPSLKERVVMICGILTERVGLLIAAMLLVMGYIMLAVLFYQTVIDPNPVDNGISEVGTVVLSYAE